MGFDLCHLESSSFSRNFIFNILTPMSTHKSPEMHWRTFHFRALRDSRYKRNKNGSIRIVFVHDTIVGGTITPYHLNDLQK